jgi:ribosome-associated translation inhibitor RaiA
MPVDAITRGSPRAEPTPPGGTRLPRVIGLVPNLRHPAALLFTPRFAVIFQLRTDNHIANSEELSGSIRADVEVAIGSRYGDRIRRIEVYLEDVNAGKGGIDIRCSVELHLAGHPAVAAEGRAADVDSAVDGAVERVLRVVEKQLGRQADRAGHTSAAGEGLESAWPPARYRPAHTDFFGFPPATTIRGSQNRESRELDMG